jgi:type I restriction enzyme, S subunit
MELKYGYKLTEVGVIPEDWKVLPMEVIGDSFIGLTYSPSDVREYGVLVLRASNIQDGRLTFEDNVFVDMNIPERTVTRANDLLICVRNGSRRLIGKCAIIEEEAAGSAFGAFMSVFRSPYNPLLFFQFQHDIINYQITQLMGATINQITNKDLAKFKVVIPPTTAEQEAIAEALSDADALIESLEQLIAKKRNIKQGAMQELLTGRRRLPGFSGEWEVKSVGDLLRIQHGKSQRDVEDSGGAYPILASGGQIGTAREYLYNKPSVLIGRKETIDRPQYIDQPFWTVDTLFYSIVYVPNVAKYLYYQFCLINWRQYNEASGVPSLNAKTIEQIELKVPLKDEQTAIATILSDMDAEIAALETKLEKARQVKQGMMHNLLTGRIRLV